MKRIDIFDCEAERINILATRLEDRLGTSFAGAFVMEAIFDLVDHEANLYGTTAEELIARYIP